MWIYIITWCISVWIMVPCPDSGRLDEFGKGLYGTGCLVNHGYTEERCGYDKQFINREQAFNFYNRALSEEKSWATYESLVNVKIDSSFVLKNSDNQTFIFKETDSTLCIYYPEHSVGWQPNQKLHITGSGDSLFKKED